MTILALLTLPIQATGRPISWVLAVGLSAYSAINVIVVARTRNFERFVILGRRELGQPPLIAVMTSTRERSGIAVAMSARSPST